MMMMMMKPVSQGVNLQSSLRCEVKSHPAPRKDTHHYYHHGCETLPSKLPATLSTKREVKEAFSFPFRGE